MGIEKSNAGMFDLDDLVKVLTNSIPKKEIEQEISESVAESVENGMRNAASKISKVASTEADQISEIMTKAIKQALAKPNEPVDLSGLLQFDIGTRTKTNLEKKIMEQMPKLVDIISSAMNNGFSGRRSGNRTSIENLISGINVSDNRISTLSKAMSGIEFDSKEELQKVAKTLSQYILYIKDLEDQLSKIGFKRNNKDLYLPFNEQLGKFVGNPQGIKAPFDPKILEQSTAALYNLQRAWDSLKDYINANPIFDGKDIWKILGFKSPIDMISLSMDAAIGTKTKSGEYASGKNGPARAAIIRSAAMDAYSTVIKTPLRKNRSGLSDNWGKLDDEIKSQSGIIEESKELFKRSIDDVAKFVRSISRDFIKPIEELEKELISLAAEYEMGANNPNKTIIQRFTKVQRERFAAMYGAYQFGGGQSNPRLEKIANELFLSPPDDYIKNGLITTTEQKNTRTTLGSVYSHTIDYLTELRSQEESNAELLARINAQYKNEAEAAAQAEEEKQKSIQQTTQATEVAAQVEEAASNRVIREKKEEIQTVKELREALSDPDTGLIGGKYIAGVRDDGTFSSPLKTGKITDKDWQLRFGDSPGVFIGNNAQVPDVVPNPEELTRFFAHYIRNGWLSIWTSWQKQLVEIDISQVDEDDISSLKEQLIAVREGLRKKFTELGNKDIEEFNQTLLNAYSKILRGVGGSLTVHSGTPAKRMPDWDIQELSMLGSNSIDVHSVMDFFKTIRELGTEGANAFSYLLSLGANFDDLSKLLQGLYGGQYDFSTLKDNINDALIKLSETGPDATIKWMQSLEEAARQEEAAAEAAREQAETEKKKVATAKEAAAAAEEQTKQEAAVTEQKKESAQASQKEAESQKKAVEAKEKSVQLSDEEYKRQQKELEALNKQLQTQEEFLAHPKPNSSGKDIDRAKEKRDQLLDILSIAQGFPRSDLNRNNLIEQYLGNKRAYDFSKYINLETGLLVTDKASREEAKAARDRLVAAYLEEQKAVKDSTRSEEEKKSEVDKAKEVSSAKQKETDAVESVTEAKQQEAKAAEKVAETEKQTQDEAEKAKQATKEKAKATQEAAEAARQEAQKSQEAIEAKGEEIANMMRQAAESSQLTKPKFTRDKQNGEYVSDIGGYSIKKIGKNQWDLSRLGLGQDGQLQYEYMHSYSTLAEAKQIVEDGIRTESKELVDYYTKLADLFKQRAITNEWWVQKFLDAVAGVSFDQAALNNPPAPLIQKRLLSLSEGSGLNLSDYINIETGALVTDDKSKAEAQVALERYTQALNQQADSSTHDAQASEEHAEQKERETASSENYQKATEKDSSAVENHSVAVENNTQKQEEHTKKVEETTAGQEQLSNATQQGAEAQKKHVEQVEEATQAQAENTAETKANSSATATDTKATNEHANAKQNNQPSTVPVADRFAYSGIDDSYYSLTGGYQITPNGNKWDVSRIGVKEDTGLEYYFERQCQTLEDAKERVSQYLKNESQEIINYYSHLAHLFEQNHPLSLMLTESEKAQIELYDNIARFAEAMRVGQTDISSLQKSVIGSMGETGIDASQWINLETGAFVTDEASRKEAKAALDRVAAALQREEDAVKHNAEEAAKQAEERAKDAVATQEHEEAVKTDADKTKEHTIKVETDSNGQEEHSSAVNEDSNVTKRQIDTKAKLEKELEAAAKRASQYISDPSSMTQKQGVNALAKQGFLQAISNYSQMFDSNGSLIEGQNALDAELRRNAILSYYKQNKQLYDPSKWINLETGQFVTDEASKKEAIAARDRLISAINQEAASAQKDAQKTEEQSVAREAGVTAEQQHQEATQRDSAEIEKHAESVNGESAGQQAHEEAVKTDIDELSKHAEAVNRDTSVTEENIESGTDDANAEKEHAAKKRKAAEIVDLFGTPPDQKAKEDNLRNPTPQPKGDIVSATHRSDGTDTRIYQQYPGKTVKVGHRWGKIQNEEGELEDALIPFREDTVKYTQFEKEYVKAINKVNDSLRAQSIIREKLSKLPNEDKRTEDQQALAEAYERQIEALQKQIDIAKRAANESETAFRTAWNEANNAPGADGITRPDETYTLKLWEERTGPAIRGHQAKLDQMNAKQAEKLAEDAMKLQTRIQSIISSFRANLDKTKDLYKGLDAYKTLSAMIDPSSDQYAFAGAEFQDLQRIRESLQAQYNKLQGEIGVLRQQAKGANSFDVELNMMNAINKGQGSIDDIVRAYERAGLSADEARDKVVKLQEAFNNLLSMRQSSDNPLLDITGRDFDINTFVKEFDRFQRLLQDTRRDVKDTSEEFKKLASYNNQIEKLYNTLYNAKKRLAKGSDNENYLNEVVKQTQAAISQQLKERATFLKQTGLTDREWAANIHALNKARNADLGDDTAFNKRNKELETLDRLIQKYTLLKNARDAGQDVTTKLAKAAQDVTLQLLKAEDAVNELNKMSVQPGSGVTTDQAAAARTSLEAIKSKNQDTLDEIKGTKELIAERKKLRDSISDVAKAYENLMKSAKNETDVEFKINALNDALERHKRLQVELQSKGLFDESYLKNLDTSKIEALNASMESIAGKTADDFVKAIDREIKFLSDIGLGSSEAAAQLNNLKSEFIDFIHTGFGNLSSFTGGDNDPAVMFARQIAQKYSSGLKQASEISLSGRRDYDIEKILSNVVIDPNKEPQKYSQFFESIGRQVDEFHQKVSAGTMTITQYNKKIEELGKHYSTVIDTFDPNNLKQAQIAMQNYVREQAKGAEVSQKWVKNGKQLTATYVDEEGMYHRLTVSADLYRGTIAGIQAETKKAQGGFELFFNSLNGKFKEMLRYFMSYVSIMRIWGTFKQGLNIIKEYDAAVAEMSTVTNEGIKALQNYRKESFNLASQTGVTAKDIMSSTTDFLRLGESFNEATESAKQSATLLNISDFSSIKEATEALTSASQAYKELSKEDIVNKIANIGNNFAISPSGLASALQRSAAVLKTQGNDINQAMALLTSANAVVQNPENAAMGVRTIALRIAGTEEAKGELKELGEDVDDFVVQTKSKTEKLIKDYTAVASNNRKGVSVLDPNGNLRNTYDILLDISKIYKEIQEEDKKAGTNRANALVEYIAGKTRSNIAASILQNPETLENVYKAALDSEGYAAETLEKRLDSISAHLNTLQAEWQSIWTDSVTRNTVNDLVDIGSEILKIIHNLGLLRTTAIGIAGMFSAKSFLSGGGWMRTLQGMGSFETGGADLKYVDTKVVGEFNKSLAGGSNILTAQKDALDLLGKSRSAYADQTRQFIQAQQGAVNMEILAAKATGQNVFAMNAATVATTAFKTAVSALGSMLVMALVSTAVQAAFKYLDENFIRIKYHIDEAADSAKSAISSISSDMNQMNSTVKSVEKEFAELAQGVDSNGKNRTLSNESYQRYLDISNQLVEMFPELLSYYDSEGNAITSLTGDIDGITESLHEYLKAKQQAYYSDMLGNLPDIVKQYNFEVSEAKDDLRDLQNQFKELSEGLDYTHIVDDAGGNRKHKVQFSVSDDKTSEGLRKDIWNQFNIDPDYVPYGIETIDGEKYANLLFTDEEYEKFKNAIHEKSIDASGEIENLGKDIDRAQRNLLKKPNQMKPYITTVLQNMPDYLDLKSDDLKNAISKYFSNANVFDAAIESLPKNASKEDILQYFNNTYGSVIDELANNDNMQQAFIGMLNNSLSVEDRITLAKQLQDYFDANGIKISLDFILDETNENSLANLQSRVNGRVEELFNNDVKAGKLGIAASPAQELQKIMKKLNVSSEDEYEYLLKILETENSLVDAEKKWTEERKKRQLEELKGPGFTTSISNTQKLQGGFDQLDKVYKDIKDGKKDGGFDWSNILNNQAFTEAFGNMTNVTDEYKDVYDKFIKTVADSPHDIKACQSAFDDLATAYVYNSKILDDVNDSNKDVIASMLESMGITNAHAVVTDALAYNTQKLSSTEEMLTNEKWDGIEASNDLILAFYAEQMAMLNEKGASDSAKQALKDLVSAKLEANGISVNTDGDIKNLVALAIAANNAALAVANAKSGLSTAVASKTTQAYAQGRGGVTKKGMQQVGLGTAAEYVDNVREINTPTYKPTELDYGGGQASNKPSGGSGGSGGGNKGRDNRKVYDWIDRALQTIKKQEELIQIDVDDTNNSYQYRIDQLGQLIVLQEKYIETEQKSVEAREANWDEYQDKLKERFGEEEANKLIENIKNGNIDLDNYKTVLSSKEDSSIEKTDITLVDEAIDAYDKLRDSEKDLWDAEKQLHEWRQQVYDERMKQIDAELDYANDLMEIAQHELDMKDVRGEVVLASDYEGLIDQADNQIHVYEKQLSLLREQLDSLEEGTEEYDACAAKIRECEQNIRNCEKQQAEWNYQIKRLPIEYINKYLGVLENIQQDIDNYVAEEGVYDRDVISQVAAQQVSLLQARREELLKQEELVRNLRNSTEWGSEKYHELDDELQGIQNSLSDIIQKIRDIVKKLLQTPIDEITRLNSQLQKTGELLQKDQEALDAVLAAVTNTLDKERERIETERDFLNDQLQDEIDKYQDVLDLLNEQNEARKVRIDLENAQYNLDKARQQRNIQVVRNGRIEYDSDQSAIRDAVQGLDDANYAKQTYDLQQSIDKLTKQQDENNKTAEEQLKKLDETQKPWNEIAEAYQKDQDKAKADEVLGEGWQEKLLNGTDAEMREAFSGIYYANQKSIDDNQKMIEQNESIINYLSEIKDYVIRTEDYEGGLKFRQGLEDAISDDKLTNDELTGLYMQLYGAKNPTDLDKQVFDQVSGIVDGYEAAMKEAQSYNTIAHDYQIKLDDLLKTAQDEADTAKKNHEELQKIEQNTAKSSSRRRSNRDDDDDDDENDPGEFSKNPTRYGAHTSRNPYSGTLTGDEVESRRATDDNTEAVENLTKAVDEWSRDYQEAHGATGPARELEPHSDGLKYGPVGMMSSSDKFKMLQKLSLTKLDPDEVPTLLHRGEAVLNQNQINTVLENMATLSRQSLAPVPVSNSRSSTTQISMTFGDLNLPNVHDANSFAESIKMNFELAMNQQFSKR